MVYSEKEYKPIFDTPLKKVQELAIARKIIEILNKNKYSLEEFAQKNNNYQDFLNNNNMDTVVKHFSNTLNEADYQLIIEKLREITKLKQAFSDENIKTTKFDDKEYNSFKGEDKTYFLDNSRSEKTINEQLNDLQSLNNKFQTTDTKQNTENMFKELESNIKESAKLQFLSDINIQSLNQEEQALFNIAVNYQKSTNHIIRIDFGRGIIVDENDNIKKIEKINGVYSIRTDENSETKENEISYQKQLTLTPGNTSIYSN